MNDTHSQKSGRGIMATTAETVTYVVKRYWLALLAGLFLLLAHRVALGLWWVQWMAKDSYYSHGPLVPIIVGFLVWANWKKLAVIKIRPVWVGLVLVVLAIPLILFAHWSKTETICGLTLCMSVIGGLMLLLGARAVRVLLFPILYSCFMVPLPTTLLDRLTMKIQMASTVVAAKMLGASGLAVVREGVIIDNAASSFALPGPLIVGGACSGFKMFIALATFTALFVYLLHAPLWKKAVLAALALPLSIFVNSFRIASIGWVVVWTQSSDSMYKFHDTGAMIFELVLSFAILFGVAKLIGADNFQLLGSRVDQTLAEGESRPSAYQVIGRGGRGVVLTAAVGLLFLATLIVKPLDTTEKGHLAREGIPTTFGSWSSKDVEMSPEIAEILRTADMMQRRFVNHQTGRVVDFLMGAARDTKSFHDPHLCLTGYGAEITVDEVVTLRVGRPRPMTVDASMLWQSTPYNTTVVIHWYMSGSKVYSDTTSTSNAVRFAKLSDFWNVVTHPSDRKRIRRSINERQYYWYRFSTDVWDEDSDSDVEELKQFIDDFIANTKNFGE